MNTNIKSELDLKLEELNKQIADLNIEKQKVELTESIVNNENNGYDNDEENEDIIVKESKIKTEVFNNDEYETMNSPLDIRKKLKEVEKRLINYMDKGDKERYIVLGSAVGIGILLGYFVTKINKK